MDIIYHYDETTGVLLGQGVADANQLDPTIPLLPAYTTQLPPPAVGTRECARYLTSFGAVPAHQTEGEWVIHPDWRDTTLWSTADGSEVVISEPNVTPEERGATVLSYPGPGYVWRDEQWQADLDLQYRLVEQAAEQELTKRLVEATTEINRIQPAVDGGYAKPADIELLPQWQRYCYELPDVREQEGWPESPQWLKKPGVAV